MADHPTPDDRLSARLHDAVSDVEPRPALDAIQARTKVTSMSSRRPWIYAAVGAVAATAATITAVAVLADEEPATTGEPVASPTPTASATSEPSESPSTTPSESPSSDPGEASAVPVYYVGDQPAGPRLFREFHQLPQESVQAAQVQAALDEAISGSPLDPDYRTSWPGGSTVSGVTVDGTGANDVIWVDLSGESLGERPAGMSADEAELAVQQLLYTTQAVVQQRQLVSFLLGGEPTDSLLGVSVAGPVNTAPAMKVQGTVWIISPQDGDTVDPTFTVEGRGAFFEANVSWQLLQGETVVEEGFATAEEGMTLSPYTFTVENVAAGDYVLRVYDADVSGGEGPGEAEDTKRITVAD